MLQIIRLKFELDSEPLSIIQTAHALKRTLSLNRDISVHYIISGKLSLYLGKVRIHILIPAIGQIEIFGKKNLILKITINATVTQKHRFTIQNIFHI